MTVCNRCGTQAATRLFHNEDSVTGHQFAVVSCDVCGLVRTHLDPAQIDVSAYYDDAYYGDAGRRFPPLMEWAIGRFRARRVRAVLRHHRGPGRILDVGCGRGLMLADFVRRGWQAVGTEFSAELTEAVENRYGFPVHSAENLSDCGFDADFFDVVTLWHSLEHLTRPIDTLREVHRILKPGGIVVIEVPNLQSWQATVGGGRWFHLDTPRHLTHFSRDGLIHLAGDLGYDLCGVQTFSLEYGPYGFAQTLLNRLTRQPNVLYGWLKGRREVAFSSLEGVVTLLKLPNAIWMGCLLEALAVAANRGGIVRITLRKSSPS